MIGVAGVAVGALVIGAVVSHAIDNGGDAKQVLPATGRTIPVVGPADGSLGPASADAPAPAAAPNGVPAANLVGSEQRYTSGGSGSAGGSSGASDSSGGGGGGGAGGRDGGDRHATATSAPSGSPATTGRGTTATTGASATTGTTAPGTGGPAIPGVTGGTGPVVTGVDLQRIQRFIDPCALGSGDHCPHLSIGGTILPINGPRAFAITGGGSGDCPGVDASRRDEELVVWITTTEPAPLDVQVRGSSDPTNRFQNFTPVIADSERARWDGAQSTDVMSCIEVRAPYLLTDPTHHFTVDVTAYEHNDRALVHQTSFSVTFTPQDRPHMHVTPGDIWPTSAAIATDIPGGPTRVPHVVLVANEQRCTDAAKAAARPYSGGAPIAVDAPGYGYDRAYTEWVQPYFVTATDLSTGNQVAFESDQRYVLCVWWRDTSGAEIDRQEIRMRAPDRYRMEIRAKSVDFARAAPFTLNIDAFDGACRIHLTGNATHLQYLDPRFSGQDYDGYPSGDPASSATVYPNGPTSCDQPDPFTIPVASFSIGNPDGSINMDIDATLDGTDHPAAVWVPISPCPPGGGSCPYQASFSEDYVLPLGTRGSVTLQITFLNPVLYRGAPTTGGSYGWTVDPYYW